MDDRFEMKLPQPFRREAERIAEILSDNRQEIARPMSKAEAIRYAISFCHKQLTVICAGKGSRHPR